MSDNHPSENFMEKLERLDNKLEKLLAHQNPPKEGCSPDHLNAPEKEFSEAPLRHTSDNDNGKKTCEPSAPPTNPLPSRVPISAREMDSIFQKVEKINHDAEILERVNKLEKQNRRTIVLGSMFMTLTALMLFAFGYLMVQGNLLNTKVFQPAGQKVDPPQSSSGEAAAKVSDPQTPPPVVAAHDPLPAEPVLKAAEPQTVKTAPDPKPAAAADPVKYVGWPSSNKYHYPSCKWAAGISRYQHRTFSSVKEAREKGCIPCPTCHPPNAD
jgi:hypothetical protein